MANYFVGKLLEWGKNIWGEGVTHPRQKYNLPPGSVNIKKAAHSVSGLKYNLSDCRLDYADKLNPGIS